MKTTLSILLIICLVYCKGSAQGEWSIEVDGILFPVQERMKYYKTQALSIYIENPKMGQKIKTYGQHSRGKKVDEKTLFQIGGMSTSFTHFLILKWVSDGILDLDDPINDHLISWKLKSRFNDQDPVTIRDLMLQTRGFKDAPKPRGYLSGKIIPSTHQILSGKKPASNRKIKMRSNLGNQNYSYHTGVILQLLVEDLTGKPFGTVLTQEIIEPLGLDNTYCVSELPDELQDQAAEGYEQNGTPIPDGAHLYPEVAVAGIWTTPTDFASYVKHIFKAARGEDNRFINQKLAWESIHPQDSYRGLLLLENNGLYWGGASRGFRSQFTGNFEDGTIITVCMNSNQNWKFMHEIMHSINRYLKEQK